MGRGMRRATAPILFLATAACAAPAGAQTGPTLAGKTVRMIIGFGPGGGYDLWGRLVARHIGKHLPGAPTVVPENMPGAGSFTAASYLYNLAPKDGTAIGIIASDAPLGPIFKQPGAQFDTRSFTWLGTPTTDINVCIASQSAAVKSVEDLRHTQLIVGDTGPGTDTQIYPKALDAVLGLKFKLISGFPSSADVFLAMERHEVDGICESYQSVIQKRPTWMSSGQVRVLMQGGAEPNAQVKAPFVPDLAETDEQKEELEFIYAQQGVGRPFLAPPGLDQAHAKMVREAFAQTMKDPEFVADATKSKVLVDARDGAYLLGIVDGMYATPRPVIDKLQTILAE